MSTTTPNLGLIKPELTDVADITTMNPNWDKIDEELSNIGDTVEEALADITPEKIGAVKKDGDVMTGSLTVIDNFNVNKTMDGVEYKTYVRPINYSIASNGDYSTGLIHYKDSTSHAQLMFNKDGVMLRDNVTGKAYQIFGQHNIDLIKNFCLPLTGGKLSGNLDFEKVDNGSATIYKNHSDTADYGLIIRDVKADGGYNQLYLCAAEDTLKYRDTAGKTSHIFGQHNTELLAPAIKSLLTGGEISMVRHIQRGTISGNGPHTITLSGFTNVNKMVVFLDGNSAYTRGSNDGMVYNYYLKSLSVNSLEVEGSKTGETSITGSYQVVEYY